jgi:predicted nucleotidyltransferase
MSEETRRQDDRIGHLRRTIVQAIDPQQIVLFGSHARGEARANSDVDLLVVHDTDQTNREVRRRIEQLFLDRRFGLDLLVRTPEDVRRNVADRNPFYTHDIFEEGRVLYERPQEEEASLEAVW